jgi:hypothetical protein
MYLPSYIPPVEGILDPLIILPVCTSSNIFRRLLWTFDIKPVTDPATGEAILPDPDRLTQGIMAVPEEFEVKIISRDRSRADLIEKEWQEVEQLLDPIIKQWSRTPEGMVMPSL